MLHHLSIALKNLHASGTAEKHQSLTINVTFTISGHDRAITPARVYQRMFEFVKGIKNSSSANIALPSGYYIRYEDLQANYDIHVDDYPAE